MATAVADEIGEMKISDTFTLPDLSDDEDEPSLDGETPAAPSWDVAGRSRASAARTAGG
jgi:hypothetical protein